MQSYITTTGLRTKSAQLVDTLRKGNPVSLIHRSQVIGEIKPIENQQPVIFDADKFKKLLKSLGSLRRISIKEREKIYRKHLEEKYGKNFS